MTKQAKKPVYVCRECGFETAKWAGMCIRCETYNAFAPAEPEEPSDGARVINLSASDFSGAKEKLKTGVCEFNALLGGGVTPGGLCLLGGEPGSGKSTLLLQICSGANDFKAPILYVSGEETPLQIKSRANRLSVVNLGLNVLADANIKHIENACSKLKPCLILIDSIQTVFDPDTPGAQGSVTQVRECARVLDKLAKNQNAAMIIVGHVTKDGAIAGPKTLEHMVDVVLYFEGENNQSHRIIRCVKNRFGPAGEIGVFEMKKDGLRAVLNPSEFMLKGRAPQTPGSVITAVSEGSRAYLAEVQTLVCQTSFASPRRSVTGVDFNRSVMLVAALENKVRLGLAACDVYINIAGGFKINEPAADLAIVAAMAGSIKKIAVSGAAIFGEVGLTGEVRAVSKLETRLKEVFRFGFTECVVPQANLDAAKALLKTIKTQNKEYRVYGAANVAELINLLF